MAIKGSFPPQMQGYAGYGGDGGYNGHQIQGYEVSGLQAVLNFFSSIFRMERLQGY